MKKIFYIILTIILVGGVILKLNINNDNTKETQIRYVSMDDIIQIMNENKDYIILDVRTVEEYNEGHIPKAINIPNETIGSNQINESFDKNQLILIYCRSGNRSKQAAEKLKNLGYTNLIEFGGIIDWKGEIVSQKESSTMTNN